MGKSTYMQAKTPTHLRQINKQTNEMSQVDDNFLSHILEDIKSKNKAEQKNPAYHLLDSVKSFSMKTKGLFK